MDEIARRYVERIRDSQKSLLRALDAPGRAQDEFLMDVVRRHEGTEFGRQHRFDSVRNTEDYRSAVPVRDYDDFAPWIERAAAGEPNVLTSEPPVLFLMTSGTTTGAWKTIPATKHFLVDDFLPFKCAAWANVLEQCPGLLERRDTTLDLKWDPRPPPAFTPSGAPHMGASLMNLEALSGFSDLGAHPGIRAPWSTVPTSAKGYEARVYHRLRLALESDLRLLVAINPAMLVALVHQLEDWAPELLADLAAGTMRGAPIGEPQPHRAREIAAAMKGGGGTLHPRHVWPGLRAVFTWTAGIAKLYIPGLRAKLGPDVAFLSAPLAASESPITMALDGHPNAGVPVVNAAFFEFAPATEPPQGAATLLAHELELGAIHQVVVTQSAGLYRYAVGDVVRVVGHRGGLPLLEYVGRTRPSSPLGDRMIAAHVLIALERAMATTQTAIANFTCCPTSDPQRRYAFLVEPSGDGLPDAAGLASELDRELCRLNRAYDAHRRGGAIDATVVHFVPRNAFYERWRDKVLSGVSPTQVKDVPLQKDDAVLRAMVPVVATRDRS